MDLVMDETGKSCNNCQKTVVPLLQCARCKKVTYCSKACQYTSWKAEHQRMCRTIVSPSENVPFEVADKPWVDKYLVVTSFLRNKVNAKVLSNLAYDEELVCRLHAKIAPCEANNRLMKAELEHVEAEDKSFQLESTRLKEKLVASGVDEEALPPKARDALGDLTKAKQLLSTTSPHPAMLREGILDIQRRLFEVTDQGFAAESQVNRSKRKTVKAIAKASKLKVDGLAVAEKAKAIKTMQAQTQFYEKKGAEYLKSAGSDGAGAKQLRSCGKDASLTHKRLAADADAVATKEEELQRMEASIQTYHWLPPDPRLAKVKLEEKRQELAALSKQAEKALDLDRVFKPS